LRIDSRTIVVDSQLVRLILELTTVKRVDCRTDVHPFQCRLPTLGKLLTLVVEMIRDLEYYMQYYFATCHGSLTVACVAVVALLSISGVRISSQNNLQSQLWSGTCHSHHVDAQLQSSTTALADGTRSKLESHAHVQAAQQRRLRTPSPPSRQRRRLSWRRRRSTPTVATWRGCNRHQWRCKHVHTCERKGSVRTLVLLVGGRAGGRGGGRRPGTGDGGVWPL
jgi:hypothetical protein